MFECSKESGKADNDIKMKKRLGEHYVSPGQTPGERQDMMLGWKLERALLDLGLKAPERVASPATQPPPEETRVDPVPGWKPTTVRSMGDVREWAAAHHFRLPYLVRVWPEVASYRLASTGHEFYPVCTDGVHVWGETALGPREVHASNVEGLHVARREATPTSHPGKKSTPRRPRPTPTEALEAKLAEVLAQLGIGKE